MYLPVEGPKVDIELQYRLPSLKSSKIFRTSRYLPTIDKGSFFVKLVNINEENTQLGIIVTKKIGNSVARNFIRRRIKNAVHTSIKAFIPPSYTAIIVIGKRESKKVPFSKMVDDFSSIMLNYNKQQSAKY